MSLMVARLSLGALLLLAGSACGGSTAAPALPASDSQLTNAALQTTFASPIKHVVIVVQENRTPDYLFQGIPGADIAQYGIDSHGKRVALQPVSLGAKYRLKHDHPSFLLDYDNGKMDGFDAGLRHSDHLHPFAYAPESQVRPYHDMAKEYTFADHMFETNEGPSFPAHLYLISGTASAQNIVRFRVSDNPYNSESGQAVPGGCDSQRAVVVPTIRISNGEYGPTPFPCFDRAVLSDFLEA